VAAVAAVVVVSAVGLAAAETLVVAAREVIGKHGSHGFAKSDFTDLGLDNYG